MNDTWIENEWDDLCQRLTRCSEEMAPPDGTGSQDQRNAAAEFATAEPPARYPELLERVTEAAALAISWQ